MKTSKVTIALAVALCLLGLPKAQAQDANTHELSLSFQGIGIGSMPFSGSASWNDNPGLSLGFNVGYTYWLNQRVGLRTGLRFNRMAYSQKIQNLDLPFSAVLPLSSIGIPGGTGNTTVNLHSAASAIEESRHYYFLELPLQAALRFDQVYLNLGISLSKAVSADGKYEYADPACEIEALPELGITMPAPVPMTMTGEKEGSVKNADMAKPFYLLLDAEAGYNFRINEVTSIGVGLFGRFAPFAYKTDNTPDHYAIHDDATFNVIQPAASTLVEKMGYYEVGLSLGVNFGWKGRKAYAENDPSLVPLTQEYVNQMSAELEAMKSARENAENELAAMKSARKKLENELATAQKAAEKAAAEKAAAEKAAAADKAAADKAAADKKAAEKKAAKVRNAAKPALDEIVVNFDNNKTKPLADEATEAKLQALCTAMGADTSIHALVTGHTDNTGTKRYNQRIGYKRAAAVKRKMVKMGAPAKNITCESKGLTDPVDDNASKEGRANNRRVTVKIK